jgi:predicted nucleic acid-binding Zn ribbon protein
MKANHIECIVCSVKLQGRQKKYCSNSCKYRSNNVKNQNYQAQQVRGFTRRKFLIEKSGGCCSSCGYNANLAALCFHHINENTKSFQIDLRNCSNRSLESLYLEVDKCILLCANCHTEIHNPQ